LYALVLIAMLCGCDGVFGLTHLPDRIDDGGTSDGVSDGAGADAPDGLYFQVANGSKIASSASLQYSVFVPDGESQVMLVFVAAGNICTDMSAPTIQLSVPGTIPTNLGFVQGTPCQPATSRSELWLITSPPPGMNNVNIALTGASARTLHSIAMVFAGVDQAMPVRAAMGASNVGMSSTITFPSAAGDLVASFVGQGFGIAGPGAGTTLQFRQNVNANTTLNNSAGGTMRGASPNADASWMFESSDEWQAFAVSLRPAN
jgi:hypothetical protein